MDEQVRKQARELVSNGVSRRRAARMIGVTTDMVNRACQGMNDGKVRAILNPHVPEDDECNVHGFWVPTLDEIDASRQRLRQRNLEAMRQNGFVDRRRNP